MRCYTLVFFCALLSLASTEPDPKKYNKVEKVQHNVSLTKDERKFLREVEEKFGVKSRVQTTDKIKTISNINATDPKPLFPAVVAIEIFNDTDTKSKGKRTIDANLGYGYKTNNGYQYSYFGKSSQDKGKFMIYPYSQEDIPARHGNGDRYIKSRPTASSGETHVTSVEIQPSQAFELVEVDPEETGYHYKIPSNPLQTKYEEETEKPSQTLYTTYNGHEFSGLSGHFPKLMPNYFVNPTQLLKNPQYQSVGLTQDHLRTQHDQQQGIVPVLVLRVPSSYLKNPSAELYADLPHNYPLSQYLNTVNLQEMVNQYFKKNGFPVAPQIKAYQNAEASIAHTDHEHYNNHARPAYKEYTNTQYSGQPIVAKYPDDTQVYGRPGHQYQYKYVYEPHHDDKSQAYYDDQSQYTSQTDSAAGHYQQVGSPDASAHYGTSEATADEGYSTPSSSYESSAAAHQLPSQSPQYVSVSEAYPSQDPSEYGSVNLHSGAYSSSSDQNNPVSVYPSRLIHSENYAVNPSEGAAGYTYHSQTEDSSHTGLSENYPSKDHTIATVYPYPPLNKPSQMSGQSVSYVMPTPISKYQSHFRVMVPQTILTDPSTQNTPTYHYMKQSYPSIHSQSPVSEQIYRGPHGAYSTSGKTHGTNHYTYSKRMVKPARKPAYKSRKTTQKKTNST